ncbi:MAG TPA: sigma-70 family RNA polymerase sigma factor [Chitinophagales bacterium]|nr:sigma-70 family RNA polymerase sigma factor [Chitinophagales bacterium]HMU98425.1 sigma-70 family RNA polymerase sigma factor [Chitinophagales bacterium]HMV03027.1 sigma-70 family RNA polymerase sigma factor [Chitinophagales bacterium]HMW95032.1 sigma-70 family RNA polymerase sigma factor [Chitinophagales bacterium]HMY42283.1 sigma-70 family RNA polymerase sigma factor [Chitinophagales bacterium]
MREEFLSDEVLIHQYTLGNNKSIGTLFYRHQKKVVTYLYFKVNDQQLAEDIFIESFFRIIKSIDNKKYMENGKFYNLLIRVAKNSSIDYFRKIKSQPRIVDIDGLVSIKNLRDNYEEQEYIEQNERVLEKIKAIILELPDDEREIVVLKHYADLTFREISELTGINLNTALSKMRIALQRIRKMAEQRQIKY